MAYSSAYELLQSTPTVTVGIIGLCSLLYIAQIVCGIPLHYVTLCYRNVFFHHEYYRIFVSSLFHANLMHYVMNMLATGTIGTALEKEVGTLSHCLTVITAIPLTSCVYLFFAFLRSAILNNDSLSYQHSVGFSGVIFHMLVLECNTGQSRLTSSRSIFGLCQVPSYLYPWVLLFLLPCLIPNLSTAGHLAGIVTGTLELYGLWDGILIIADHAYLQSMENNISVLRWLAAHHDGYIPTPPTSRRRLERPSISSLITWIDRIRHSIRTCYHTIWITLMGSGPDHRINLPFFAATSIDSANTNREVARLQPDDSSDWNGVPQNELV